MISNNNGFIKLATAFNFENRRVNLMGIVTEFSIPRRSKGTDFVVVLKIIDGSLEELCVTIFSQSLDELPHVKAYKDFVVLYEVQIKRYSGEHLYACYDKKKSSFALLDGQFTVGIRPYQTSSGCRSLEPDKDIIIYWRKWSRGSEFGVGTTQYLLSLKDINERVFFDLVCQVLHICEVSNVWILLVWDGTDITPPSLHMALESEEHNLPPLQIESLPLSADIVSSFPPIGTIFVVIAESVYVNLGQHFKIVKKWMRLRNISCKVHSALWCGLLTPSSKIRLLSDDADIVQQRIRNYINRVREMSRVPSSTTPRSSSLTGN